jgi:hypothetical protein
MAPRTAAPAAPKWTPEQLLAVKHVGPGIIGQEMHDAAQAYVKTTLGGTLGPAITSNDPKYNQAGPVKIVDGKPIFAHELAAK